MEEVPPTLMLTPTQTPTKVYREPSGYRGAEYFQGKECVARPQFGTCGADFGRKHVLDEPGALWTVSPHGVQILVFTLKSSKIKHQPLFTIISSRLLVQ